MSTCTFCGKPAGLLHHSHRECREAHEAGKIAILDLILQAIPASTVEEHLTDRIQQICGGSFISDTEQHSVCINAWSSAVDASLQDHVLNEEAEKRLIDLKTQLSLTTSELQQAGAWDKVVKSAAIRDLLNGTIPARMTFDQPLPFNLQKGEQIVWVFERTDYIEDISRRQYVGGSRGVSVRVMKGVYYRIGAFKGEAIDRTERLHRDTGLVAATDKNIYFCGPNKTFRIPYRKIVSFEPFADGIGFIRDTATAKHQFLITHDGWFTYNLVTNLARL